jgi:hypothetical protein
MDEPRILFTYHNLTVEVETTPSEEILEHMHGTVLGQPGGFRYRHTNLKERLSAPGENYFMYLRKSGKMLGSVGLRGKPGQIEGMKFDSWLIRYFSIKAPLRSVPKSRKEKKDSSEENRRGALLHRFVQPVAANPALLRKPGAEVAPAILYAVIEQTNLRSMNFSTQMGMETVREIASFSFSRLNPSKSGRLERLSKDDHDHMLSLLRDFYSDYTLFIPDPLFSNDDYFIIREEGRVVAGIQIYHVEWKIVDMGSGMSNRLIRLLTKIPWFGKRINPELMKLLAFDGIYCEKGHEPALYELMEGVLENSGTYVAMLMIDNESDLHRIFRENRKLGLLHSIQGTMRANLRARFINLPEKIRDHFLDHPNYICTYDNS